MGKRVISTWTNAMGMVRQTQRCPSPSLLLPGPSSPLPHPSDHPLCQCSCGFCWTSSILRPRNLQLTPWGGIALHTYSNLINGEPSALCPLLNLLELAKSCMEGTG